MKEYSIFHGRPSASGRVHDASPTELWFTYKGPKIAFWNVPKVPNVNKIEEKRMLCELFEPLWLILADEIARLSVSRSQKSPLTRHLRLTHRASLGSVAAGNLSFQRIFFLGPLCKLQATVGKYWIQNPILLFSLQSARRP